jgi:hypothetical protein
MLNLVVRRETVRLLKVNAETRFQAHSNLHGTCGGRSYAGQIILLVTFGFSASIVQPKFHIYLQNN